MSKYRIKFTKHGTATYISHLDLMRTMHRVFIRADLKVKHSEGFNPHPKMVFAMPLSVGTESECELLDFELDIDVEPEKIPGMLNATMPEGITVTDCYIPETKFKEISWLTVTGRFEYDDASAFEKSEALTDFYVADSIVIRKKTKRGEADVDIKPLIREICFSASDKNTVTVFATVAAGEKVLNPELIAGALEQLAPNLKPDFTKFRRMQMCKENENSSIIAFR